MKTVILSYDYELFFGDRSGTVLNSIIEPTNKLMDVMEQNGFRGNFFVDYLMFQELEKQTEEHAVADLKLLKDQIRDMVRRGHRVELHLHPHWIDAKYNGDGTWDFSDFSHYSLSSLDESTIVDMFVNGTNYLTALAREIDSNYKIVAFRAGGWAVQPFDKLKKGFLAAEIKIDSSASYGIFNYLNNSYYDFREMPHKTCYRFEDDVCNELKGGSFVEVPITSYRFQPLCYIHRLKSAEKHKEGYEKSFADGTHFRSDMKCEKKGKLKTIVEKVIRRNMLGFSYNDPFQLRYVLEHSNHDIYCFIDHPKDVSLSTIDGIQAIGGGSFKSVNYCDLINNK